MSLKLSDFQIPPPENEEQFERLCLDLYKLKFGDQTQRNGKRGQSQDGVDIVVQDQHIGIQCKKTSLNGKIKKKVLHDEVKKAINFSPSLKRFILATTCKRDAKIQEEARLISEEHEKKNLFSVEIHSWDEIKQFFDKYPEVYEGYYPTSQKTSSVTSAVSAVQSESRHETLNKIRDLINRNKLKTALKQLEDFEKEKWEQLENKEKYRVLTNMASVRMGIRQEMQASELLVKAWQFNQEDENANVNCALAYLIIDDIENSKKYIEKTKQLNSLNVTACILEVQIKDKEKQPLKDIVSSIPQDMRKKHQVACILSYISMKRGQYTEAKKWLDIFYKAKESENWKNVMDEAVYADMSLGLILAKQDVFSGKYVPDNLKDKLEEIIKIYKKLVTDSQYSELKDFNPNWYLHYALALELKGKLNDAISILQEGIRKFSYDDHLKIELSRLFRQKGDIAQSISILEKLLGLPSLNSDDSLGSISKKSFTVNKIDISEKSFSLALILTDLYFQNKQPEKAQELLRRITESPSIDRDDRLEVKQYSIFKMIALKKTDEAEEMLKPLFEEDSNNIFNLILASKIEEAKGAKEELSGKIQESVTHKNKKIQYLKEAYNIFKDKQYNDELDQSDFSFKNKERLRDIQQLSQELYFSKMYKETEPLLEEITNKNLNHPEVFKLLHTYFENGKNRLAVELAKDLFKKFPQRIEAVNTLFLIYESLGDIKTAIQYYEDFLKLNPGNEFIRIELALAYIQSEQISKAKNLLKKTFNLNQLSVEQMNRLSLTYIRTGNAKKALETQYKCMKSNPKELKPQSIYFDVLTFLDHPNLSDIPNFEKESKIPMPDNKSFLHPEKVGLDCYVRIKDVESSEEAEIIIEKDADIYNPDHELSQMLFERKQEDVIPFNDKQYRIMEIKSKYVNKYQEIVKEAEKRFASKTFLKSVHIPTGVDDIKKVLQALKQMVPDISNQEEGLNKLFQLYRKGEATIGSIAKISGKHPIEIIGELIFSEKYKFISAVSSWENDKKIRYFLDNKTDILIDLSSLIIIHQLEIEEYIRASKFKFYICQSTLDSLKEYIQKTTLHSKDGLLTVGLDNTGNFGKSFIPAKIIKQNLNFYMKVKTWAEECCLIRPISTNIVLNREKKREREKLLGKEFIDALLATDDSCILLCEDAVLRKHAEQEFSISGVRLLDLIEYFERQVIIDNNQAVKFKAKLVKFNQTYISIDHNVLLFLLKEAEYSVDNTFFQRGLFFLTPVSNLQGVINVVADFLIEVYQVPSLLPYNKQVITKELLDKSSFGREESSKQIAYQIIQLVQVRTQFLPILQNEICEYIIRWLKNKIY